MHLDRLSAFRGQPKARFVPRLSRAALTCTGKAEFHNLHIKKDLLERRGLPVEIVTGNIGLLQMTIPWTALATQPIRVVLEDVYVLARARKLGKVDPVEDERTEQAAKQDKLKRAEEVDNAAQQVDPDDSARSAFCCEESGWSTHRQPLKRISAQ